MQDHFISCIKNFDDALNFFAPMTEMEGHEMIVNVCQVIRRHTLTGGSRELDQAAKT